MSPKEGYWAPGIPDNPSAIAQATVTGSWRACGERERRKERKRERERGPLPSSDLLSLLLLLCFSHPGSPNGLLQTHVLFWSSCSTPFQLVTSTQRGIVSSDSSNGAETTVYVCVCVCVCVYACACVYLYVHRKFSSLVLSDELCNGGRIFLLRASSLKKQSLATLLLALIQLLLGLQKVYRLVVL